MPTTEEMKQAAHDAWTSFQKAADDMKQKVLDAAGQTRDNATAATRMVLDSIDNAVKWSKDQLPK